MGQLLVGVHTLVGGRVDPLLLHPVIAESGFAALVAQVREVSPVVRSRTRMSSSASQQSWT
jgi:hypothetical protein